MKKGISPTISTVIITATLLVILLVASFFATNLLEIQVQNSEFEQAKTAILLLDKTIIDVALRQGAASSVQFSQRSGGIGIYEGGKINITVYSDSSIRWSNTTNTYVIKYRGGNLVAAAEVNFTNPGGLIITNASKPLGYVRVEVENGVWIILDYNRIRITVNQNLGTMDIYFIRLAPGFIVGSGPTIIRVQNNSTNVELIRLESPSPVRVSVAIDDQNEVYPSLSEPGILVSAVRFIEVTIEVSIM